MNYDWMESPLGRLRLAADAAGIREIHFDPAAPIPAGWHHRPAALQDCKQQLGEYFLGERRTFDLPMAPTGTAFQLEILQALQAIPYGQTLSYGELAQKLGRPRAVRAVGGGCGRNPLPVLIPCHRVIGSNGRLTGFAGGLAAKRWLLEHESRA